MGEEVRLEVERVRDMVVGVEERNVGLDEIDGRVKGR